MTLSQEFPQRYAKQRALYAAQLQRAAKATDTAAR
jgi:hypothetical protein